MAGGSTIVLSGLSLTSVVLFYAFIRFLRGRKPRCSLQDKVVLVTGASSGVGEACAQVFYFSGAKVILCARQELELNRVRNELLGFKRDDLHEPVVLALDLADIKNIPDFVQKAVGIHGHIDVLVNNGGLSYRGDILKTDIETDIKLMTVNYFGQVALTRAVLPHMKKSGFGHIVAVSSVQGKIAIPFRSAYAASKHALQAFFDCLRAELHDSNIGVSVVSPGYIRTNLSVNAVTGDGSTYGVMDETTASGMQACDVAQQIAECVMYQRPELLLCSMTHRIAAYLRNIAPGLFFYIMKRRARKQNLAGKKFD